MSASMSIEAAQLANDRMTAKSTRPTTAEAAIAITNTNNVVMIGSDSTATTTTTTIMEEDDDDDIGDHDAKEHEPAMMSAHEIDALYGNDEHLFRVGDHVRVYKRALGVWPFYHHGIVTQIRVMSREGRAPRNVIEKIVHFTHRNRRQRQVICETSITHFASGAVDALEPVHHDNSRFPLNMAARRARQKIGCTRYHPVQRNCEHFATWCHTGRENSAQIRGYAQMAIALSWGAVLGLAINAIASSDSSTPSTSTVPSSSVSSVSATPSTK